MIMGIATTLIVIIMLVIFLRMRNEHGRQLLQYHREGEKLLMQNKALIEVNAKLDNSTCTMRTDTQSLLDELNRARDSEGKTMFYIRQFCKNIEGKGFKNKKGPIEKCAAFKLLKKMGNKE